MALLIILIALLFPAVSSAQIPAVERLGNEASKQKDVEYESVGNFMLGMASTFADKEQRSTFAMLKHIDLIECRNAGYEQTLESRTMTIINSIGAKFLVSSTDERGRNDVYILKSGNTVSEVIIITHGKSGGLAVVAMSGTIPYERLGELSKLGPPDRK